jgi:hypothetical protein
MKPSTMMRKSFLALALLATSLVMGCNTFHYYDIDVKFAPGFALSDAGMIQFCNAVASGADSSELDFPDNNTNRPGGPICPVQQNYPDLGTFEFSTFADSGTLHLVVSAYSTPSPQSSSCFANGSTDIPATSEITTTGSITLSMNTSGCK